MKCIIEKVLNVAIGTMFNMNLRGHGFGYKHIHFYENYFCYPKCFFVTGLDLYTDSTSRWLTVKTFNHLFVIMELEWLR